MEVLQVRGGCKKESGFCRGQVFLMAAHPPSFKSDSFPPLRNLCVSVVQYPGLSFLWCGS